MPTPKTDPAVIQQAHEAVATHGSIAAAAKALGIARSTLQHRIAHAAPTQTTQKAGVGKSLSDFRSLHDKDYIVPAKIKRALSELGEGWCYEADFLRLASVSVSDLALYRDSFGAHWLVVDRSGKRVWAGSKAMAEKMREMIRA